VRSTNPGNGTRFWLLLGPSQAFGPELIRQLLARGDRVASITDQPEDADGCGESGWRGTYHLDATTLLTDEERQAIYSASADHCDRSDSRRLILPAARAASKSSSS
jgi:hypothetical protein